MPVFYPALDQKIKMKAQLLDVDELFLFSFVETLAPKVFELRTTSLKEADFFKEVRLRHSRLLVAQKEVEWRQYNIDLPDEVFATLRQDTNMAEDLSYISWDQPIRMIHHKAYIEGVLYLHSLYKRYYTGRLFQVLANQTQLETTQAFMYLKGLSDTY